MIGRDTTPQLVARLKAQDAVEAGVCAHWAETEDRFAYHAEQQVKALRAACDALGFDMVKRESEAATTPEAAE